MLYGLIGEKLGHSFSKEIHEALAGYDYQLCPLNRDEFTAFMQTADFAAINVTIPYKEAVIPYLDKIDERAAAIGAVNTIVNQKGILVGYNTDFDGVCYLLRRHNISLKDRQVLILGTGGTCKTVTAVARHLGAADVQIVSRSGGEGLLNYRQAEDWGEAEVIINTTPRGMYPHNEDEPLLDLRKFPRLQAVADVIYNPLQTRLVLQAKALGITACGGLEMLVAQAKYAAEHFLGRQFDDEEIERIYQKLRQNKLNIALIGMPGSGKTTVGKLLAQALGKPFVDADEALEQQAGRTIPQIFAEDGENYFRRLESETIAQISREGGQIIATGGGVVLRPENIENLRQNSLLIWLDKQPENLSLADNRPLSPGVEANLRLYQQRQPLYQAAADVVIVNEGTAEAAAAEIVHKFKQY